MGLCPSLVAVLTKEDKGLLQPIEQKLVHLVLQSLCPYPAVGLEGFTIHPGVTGIQKQ